MATLAHFMLWLVLFSFISYAEFTGNKNAVREENLESESSDDVENEYS